MEELTPGLGTCTPWQNWLALSSAPRVDMQDQEEGSRGIIAIKCTTPITTTNMAKKSFR